jgi:hypothetical protein
MRVLQGIGLNQLQNPGNDTDGLLQEMAQRIQAEGKKLNQIYHQDLWKLPCDDGGVQKYPDFKTFCETEFSFTYMKALARMNLAKRDLREVSSFEILCAI